MFDVTGFRHLIVDEMSFGDALDLERLTCEAQALYTTMRRNAEREATRKRLAQIAREARDIARRYA